MTQQHITRSMFDSWVTEMDSKGKDPESDGWMLSTSGKCARVYTRKQVLAPNLAECGHNNKGDDNRKNTAVVMKIVSTLSHNYIQVFKAVHDCELVLSSTSNRLDKLTVIETMNDKRNTEKHQNLNIDDRSEQTEEEQEITVSKEDNFHTSSSDLQDGLQRDIIYTVTKSSNSWIVAVRDMVTARAWEHCIDSETGLHQVLLVQRWIDHSAYPVRSHESIIRAKIIKQVFIIRQNREDPENKCDLHMVAQVDMGGWIPQWFLDYFIKLLPDKTVEKIETGIRFLKKRETSASSSSSTTYDTVNSFTTSTN